MGVVQHHDAVSGTEKQHVANDYAQRLSQGADAALVRKIGKETFRTNFSLRLPGEAVRYDLPTYKNIHDLRNDKNFK